MAVRDVILEPSDVAAAAEMVRGAARGQLTLLPRGGGTKLNRGLLATRVDAVLSTVRLKAAIDHCPGDLTATIPSGWTLADANAFLMQQRQWLPLDPDGSDHA